MREENMLNAVPVPDHTETREVGQVAGETRYQLVDTWNGGKGGRRVLFTSTQTGREGENELFYWSARNLTHTLAWETLHNGKVVEQVPA